MATAQELLTQAQSQLQGIQETKDAMFANQTVIPADVVENPPAPLEIQTAELSPDVPKTAISAADNFLKQQQAITSQQQGQYDQSVSTSREMLQALGMRGVEEANLYESSGLNRRQGELSSLLTRISSRRDEMANADDMTTLRQGQLEGKGMDTRLVNRNQGAMARDRQLERASEAITMRAMIADAELLQGNIKNATDQINRALDARYKPMEQELQFEMMMLNNAKDFLTTAQKNEADARMTKLGQEMQFLTDARNAVSAAVASGGMQAGEAELLANMSPDDQIAYSNVIMGRVAADDRNLNRASKLASIRSSNASAARSEAELAALNAPATGSDDSLSQLAFLRDTVQRVIGGDIKDADGNTVDSYEALYEGAAPAKFAEGFRQRFMGGDTKFSRLEAQVDTLRANMLTLATDPTIKQFFGPQMSDADVRLMTAAGTTLRPGSQSPDELKSEALRIDDLLNRMQTSVQLGMQGQATSANIITAPDGRLIEIVD